MGKVISVNISAEKGTAKHPVPFLTVKKNHGILGDAHAGDWHRQISLLGVESVDKMRREDLPELKSGDFAENILTCGLDLPHLPVGTLLSVGETVLRMTQIGKECHSDCAIARAVGKCVMPTEGVFAVVEKEGNIYPGDEIFPLEEKR